MPLRYRPTGRVLSALTAGLLSLALSAAGCLPKGAATATKLAFSVQPSAATVGSVMLPPVEVVVTNDAGKTDASDNGRTITLAIGANPGGGVLKSPGAANVSQRTVAGVAKFAGLVLDKVGSGYTLVASASGLASATSAPFDIQGAPPPPPPAAALYPVGDQMALGLYSSDEDFATLEAAGWNLFHTYTDTARLPLAAKASAAGVGILGTLIGVSLPATSSLTVDEVQAHQDLAQTGAVTWWDLPEERRWWEPDEMRIVEEYAKLIRSDPAPLPVMMYIPGNYDAPDVSKYLPYVDIVPASVYPGYGNQPYAWSRWRMETTRKGILDGGAAIGKDYLAGEKTLVAILELFDSTAMGGRRISAEGAYHDFWQSLVSGAQGILVYSYFHRNDSPDCLAAWASLEKAQAELLGPERLDRALLSGAPVPEIQASVVSGPASTATFAPLAPDNITLTVSYDSVDLAARKVGSTLYVVVVNSAEAPVTVSLSGFTNATRADVLFHAQGPLPISPGGCLVLEDLEALGVRVLKVPLDAAPRSPGLLLKHGWDVPYDTYFGDPAMVAKMDSRGFDGTTIRLSNKLSEETMSGTPHSVADYESALGPVKAALPSLTTLRHDFALVYATPVGTSGFSDAAWATAEQNFANLATAARDAGLAGIFFDTEAYFGPVFESADPGLTLAQTVTQANTRGQEVMTNLATAWPTGVFMVTFGSWVSDDATAPFMAMSGIPYNDVARANPLEGPFFVGMVQKAAETGASFVDGGELYDLRSQADFVNAQRWWKTDLAKTGGFTSGIRYLPDSRRSQYADAIGVGFGVADEPSQGRAMDPATLQDCLTVGLRHTDGYVWLYTERYDWWGYNVPPARDVDGHPEWIAAVKVAKAAARR